jgi:biopolymer transport protein ExbB/TolQ
MNAWWQPVILYGVTASGLMLTLLLLVWMRWNVRALEQHLLARQAEVERKAEALRESLSRAGEELRQMEGQAVAASAGVRPGVNLSKRSHALRLHRRGQTAEQIAAALNMPRQEVELLLKVHRIVLAAA